MDFVWEPGFLATPGRADFNKGSLKQTGPEKRCDWSGVCLALLSVEGVPRALRVSVWDSAKATRTRRPQMFNATSEPRRTAPGGFALLAAVAVAGAGFGGAVEAKPAAPRISATAKYQAKAGRVTVKGSLKGMTAGTKVSVYDAADHMLLYAVQANAKSSFSLNLTDGDVPCRLQLESGAVKTVIKVAGAPKSCASTPACGIALPDQQIHEGEELTLTAAAKKVKGSEPEFSWDLGDGSSATGASVSHKYDFAGIYKVVLTGTAGEARCSDDLRVSVAPAAGTNPNPKVSEQGERPAVGAAMPGADGSNDKDAYVVMPYEETGMEGGSQINIPFNPMVPFNAMNAQVIQKVPGKPKLIDGSKLQLFYSAASSPDDPVGADSINSTSQNYFKDGSIGANFDTVKTTCSTDCTEKDKEKDTFLIEGQNYTAAAIRKSELWDHIEQPNFALRKDSKGNPDTVQRGSANGDQQNRFKPAKPPLLPDQGMRGKVDLGAGVRSMPGIADPYKANDPMPFDYASGQNAFVAQNIPLTDIDDQGRTNPYPLLRVEAKDGTGKRVAATDAVYTTASETGCRACHLKGGIAGADIWRTPVHERELTDTEGNPGPATGAGAVPPGSTADKLYGPAVNNRFDEDYSLDPNLTKANLTTPVLDGGELPKDANGIRTDRVAESRWLKPDGSTSPTNPDK
ncbi:MAG: PKD domain-containing protein, partial [Methylococcaceae bacterium]|nr:PKD domain-containing protein [Methylococcaceae bacterium]